MFYPLLHVSTQSIYNFFMEEIRCKKEKNELQRKSEHKIAFLAIGRTCTFDLIAFSRRYVICIMKRRGPSMDPSDITHRIFSFPDFPEL